MFVIANPAPRSCVTMAVGIACLDFGNPVVLEMAGSLNLPFLSNLESVWNPGSQVKAAHPQ